MKSEFKQWYDSAGVLRCNKWPSTDKPKHACMIYKVEDGFVIPLYTSAHSKSQAKKLYGSV